MSFYVVKGTRDHGSRVSSGPHRSAEDAIDAAYGDPECETYGFIVLAQDALMRTPAWRTAWAP